MDSKHSKSVIDMFGRDTDNHTGSASSNVHDAIRLALRVIPEHELESVVGGTAGHGGHNTVVA